MKKSRVYFLSFLVGIFSVFSLFGQEGETITITTFYPSPMGVYNRLVSRTFGVGDLNRDGQISEVDSPDPATNAGDLWVAGNVSIGSNNNEGARLNVRGGIVYVERFVIRERANDPDNPREGEIWIRQ